MSPFQIEPWIHSCDLVARLFLQSTQSFQVTRHWSHKISRWVNRRVFIVFLIFRFDLNPHRRMLHCFGFVRITLTTHAWRLPLLDQNACYACTSAALTKAGCVLRCAGQGVVFKGVAKATSFVTLREAFSLPQTLTPEVFGWIPAQHRFCPTGFLQVVS